uniref:Uncharacterized protein n=1 Tax=Lepeophtheirus salmonis TaxID=72036 RepID=A0A0K2UIF0_LEPSM
MVTTVTGNSKGIPKLGSAGINVIKTTNEVHQWIWCHSEYL